MKIRLSQRQIEALEIGGAFEPDGEDPLPDALLEPGSLDVPADRHGPIVSALYDAANSADESGCMADRGILQRLASKVLRTASSAPNQSEGQS